jgi:hypothetical protein
VEHHTGTVPGKDCPGVDVELIFVKRHLTEKKGKYKNRDKREE